MALLKKTNLELDHKFDPKTSRHYLNGHLSVLHCHHFSTLYIQLAIDAKETDLLVSVSEETFYRVLRDYYCKHNIVTLEDKIDIACQYYSAVGLGKMEVGFLGEDSGEVIIPVSHVDQGWIKKWGNYDAPVDYITCGYISGMFSAILGTNMGIFKTFEVESIVMGASKSRFRVVKN
jgi:hypothetical protein